MQNIIINGKFSQGGVFSTSNWIIHNVKLAMPSNPYLSTIFYLEGESGTYQFDTVPPGIYQKINISNEYKEGATLNIRYNISYKSEIALKKKKTLKSNFYIYRIDPSASGNSIRTVGNVRTHYYKRSESIYYDESDALKEEYLTEDNDFNVTLYPGDYVIGFGASYIGTSGSFMSDASELTGLGIVEIEAMADSAAPPEYTLPYTIKHFSPYGMDAVNLSPDSRYYLPVERDGVDVGIECSSYTVDQQKQYKEGFGAWFNIEPYSDDDPDDLVYTGKLSFWHRCEAGVTGEFGVYVYEREMGFVYLYEKVKVTEHWSFYTKEIDLWDGEIEVLIIPPKNTASGDKYFILNNLNLTLDIFLNGENVNPVVGGGGTYGNPYNENDGYIGYNISGSGVNARYTPRFVTNMPLKSQIYYVRIKNKYYMTRGTQTHYLCYDGFYDDEGNSVADPINPTDLSGKVRYFQKNGEITHDEYFCVNGNDIYIADDRGICYYSCKVLKSMDLSINKLPITGKEVIDIPRAKTIDITASFEEQCPSILLNIKSSDEDVIKCVSVSEDAYSGVFGYKANKSNTLTIIGVNTGIATITVSYQSLTGSIVETSFIMEVRNQIEYPANIEIDLSYQENYIAFGEEYQIKHRMRPIVSSKVPLYWYVAEDDIFTISNDGVIKLKDGVTSLSGTTTANITIINYGSGLTKTCKVHMLNQYSNLTKPIKVIITRNSQDYTSKTYTMTTGDSADFRDKTVSSSNSATNVYQNVKWSSSNPSIAMVDNYGTVTALKEGTVKIYCSCLQDAYVGSWVEVKVEPDEESLRLRNLELNTSKLVIFNTEDSFSNRYSQEFLECIYTPENTRQREVVWTSDDTRIAQVDQSGRVFCEPVSDKNNGATTTIRCTSLHNNSLVATCEVTTYNWETYEPIVWFSNHNVKACLNEQTTLRYFLPNCDYIEYIKDSTMVEIKRSDGYQTANKVSFNENQRRVFVDVNEIGTFRITITVQYKKFGDEKIYYLTDVCTLEARYGTYAPTITKDLQAVYALHNGSYVLRYDAVNDVDENFECYLSVDGTESLAFAEPLMYNGERYFYIFEQMKYPGTFNVQVKVVNNGVYTANTSKISITIPENEDNQKSLDIVKQDYDKATNEIVNFINTLITDGNITANEESEFETRFKLFNVNYENMKTMLNTCIEYIDAQIKAEQATMSTMANALASDGIEVAAYSIEENTNSNYSNVTDMDYYQNECIKALMQRVLELEAKLDYLSNNNDN